MTVMAEKEKIFTVDVVAQLAGTSVSSVKRDAANGLITPYTRSGISKRKGSVLMFSRSEMIRYAMWRRKHGNLAGYLNEDRQKMIDAIEKYG